MASENESTKLPFNGETGNVRNKGRRNNGKGPNKTPQRGVGVEKLEKMRLQQESFKTFNQQQQQLLFSNYAAFHQFPQQQQVMINNNNNNNINNVVCSSGFSVGSASASSSSSSIGYGWVFRNPFENSSKKDLSSIPNLNHHQSLDLSLKKTRLNEENIMMRSGTNAKREMPLEVWKHNPVHHNFHGFMPQASVFAYPTQNFDEKTRLNEENVVMMRGTNARREMNHHNFPIGFMPQPSVSAYPTQNHELECVEVVAVHRKGDSSLGSGRVFMEYEFFPKKDGKSTFTATAKDLFPTTTNSIGLGSGEASSSITITSYGDISTDDSVDLSLRL